MSEKVSLIRMERDVCGKLEEYEHVVDAVCEESVRRGQIKQMLREEDAARADIKARVIRLILTGIAAAASLIFYKMYFGG